MRAARRADVHGRALRARAGRRATLIYRMTMVGPKAAVAEEPERIIRFYRMFAGCPRPMRADRSALGGLPTGAFQYCEPVCIASAFGWYVFPPIDFHVQWDGTDFIWTHDHGETWQPLTTEHLPGLPDVFDSKV